MLDSRFIFRRFFIGLILRIDHDLRVVGAVAIEAGDRMVNYPQKSYLLTLARYSKRAMQANPKSKLIAEMRRVYNARIQTEGTDARNANNSTIKRAFSGSLYFM